MKRVFLFFLALWIGLAGAWGAVAHDAVSESHTGTTGSTSAASFSWTHTPVGTPKGVLVFTFVNANADNATAVTYGGVAMTAIAGGRAVDTATEPGDCKAWFLGTSVPTGAKTVAVTRTNNANVMYATCVTVTASSATTGTAGIVLLQNDQALSQQSVNDGSPGVNSVRYAAANYGGSAIPAAGAASTALIGIDFGVNTIGVVRETTAGQGARSIGFTDASDDVAAVHLAVIETSPDPTIVSCTVGADGWYADIVIAGLGTGGSYDFGLGTNNDPATGTPKITFTVVSEGYSAAGVLGTITRTIYGTHAVRKAYPNEATNEESFSTNTTVRVALSEHIYVDDNTGAGKSGTAPVVTILANFYSFGGAGNHASSVGMAVTNSSTLTYPKATANWSWPGYQSLDSTSKLRAVAFQPHGRNGKPVACVKFSLTDGTTTNTNTVTAMTYEAAVGDAVPVVEYVTTADLTGSLTQAAELTANFIAYPWVGDASSVIDTSAGTAAPTHLFGPQKHVCNRTGAYEVTVALVDDTGGSDAGANTVYALGSYPGDASAYKFATVGKAAAAIAAYNNTNYARNDGGAGIVYVADGNHVWAGSSNSYGTTPKTWLKVTRSPGSTNRAAVVFTSANNDKALGGRTLLQDVTITSSTAIQHTGEAALWFDQCTINFTGTAFIYSDGCTSWFTRNTIPACAPGLAPFSTGTSAPALIRGNTLTNFNESLLITTLLGNLRNGTTQTNSFSEATAGVAFADNKIVAYNKFMNQNTTGFITIGNQTVNRLAIVQNVFENIGTAGGFFLSLAADSSTSGDFYGVNIWNNVFAGQRINLSYNDTTTNAPKRLAWSVKNNLSDDYNIKADTFGTQNAARIGNWSQLYGVNASGNAWTDVITIGATGLLPEFAGLSTITGSDVATTYLAYTNRQAWTGSGTATGSGTYTLTGSSPALNLQRDQLLPIDLAGSTRSATDSPGAFTTAVTGIGAASGRNGVTLSGVSAVNGVSKATIQSVNGRN